MAEVIRDFRWRDGDRTVLFEHDGTSRAGASLAGLGFDEFALLTTPRVTGDGPGAALAERASSVHHVAEGGVPEAAAELIDVVRADALVAFGGGRVIDTAKAIAAVSGARVAAIPTTLSGAEVTGIHRLPAGREADAKGLVRPVVVIADPDAMTDGPERLVRSSAMNALAHGAEATYGPFANPVATLCGLEGVACIATAFDGAVLSSAAEGGTAQDSTGGEGRRRLALGAILCAHAIDSAGLSLHHVVSQTIVRVAETSHAETNAAVLPHSLEAIRPSAEAEVGAVERMVGAAPGGLARRLSELGDARPLGELGVTGDHVPEIVSQAGERLAAMHVAADSSHVEKILAAAM